MPRRAATIFSEERLIVSLPYESSRGIGSRDTMATCEGRVTEGSLREGAPAERVEEPAAVEGRSRTAEAGLTSACSPFLRGVRRSAYGVNRSPLPEGGLLHGNFSLDPTAMRSPCGLRLRLRFAQDDTQ